MSYELWVMSWRAVKSYELWVMSWRAVKSYELWVMSYELKSGEEWGVKGEEWRVRKSSYELWVMSWRAVKSEGWGKAIMNYELWGVKRGGNKKIAIKVFLYCKNYASFLVWGNGD